MIKKSIKFFVAIRTLLFVAIRVLFFVAIGFLFVAISGLPARAARLYFEPQELTAGTENEFLVAVNIEAEKTINALAAGISISLPFVPFDINEANSVINFWLDKPQWNEQSRLLTFSGIIPGGFSGQEGQLLLIKFLVQEPGQAILTFDKTKTKIFLNTPDGLEDSLILDNITIPIIKGKENLGPQLPDNNPPEWFQPAISRDPNIFEGKWFLAFATQDKGSGLDHYELLEERRLGILDLKFLKLKKSQWIIAESPSILKDQALKSYILVKAVDRAGNERVVELTPQNQPVWYENFENWVIIVIIIVAIIFSYLLIKNNFKGLTILWKKRITH